MREMTIGGIMLVLIVRLLLYSRRDIRPSPINITFGCWQNVMCGDHGFKSLSLSWAFSDDTNNHHVQSLLAIHWGSFGPSMFEPGHEGS
jgi:hypothetical protein